MNESGESPRIISGDPEPPRELGPSLPRLIAQMIIGLAALAGIVWYVSRNYHDQLISFGRAFIERFGLGGIFAGVFLADTFSFPLPPQVFFLTAITSGTPFWHSFPTACLASFCGGTIGYHMAQRLTGVTWFKRFLDRSRPKVDTLFARFGAWAVVVASITPIPFSMLCYFAGFYRMPYRLFAVLMLCRIPRLGVLYLAVMLGWG